MKHKWRGLQTQQAQLGSKSSLNIYPLIVYFWNIPAVVVVKWRDVSRKHASCKNKTQLMFQINLHLIKSCEWLRSCWGPDPHCSAAPPLWQVAAGGSTPDPLLSSKPVLSSLVHPADMLALLAAGCVFFPGLFLVSRRTLTHLLGWRDRDAVVVSTRWGHEPAEGYFHFIFLRQSLLRDKHIFHQTAEQTYLVSLCGCLQVHPFFFSDGLIWFLLVTVLSLFVVLLSVFVVVSCLSVVVRCLRSCLKSFVWSCLHHVSSNCWDVSCSSDTRSISRMWRKNILDVLMNIQDICPLSQCNYIYWIGCLCVGSLVSSIQAVLASSAGYVIISSCRDILEDRWGLNPPDCCRHCYKFQFSF